MLRAVGFCATIEFGGLDEPTVGGLTPAEAHDCSVDVLDYLSQLVVARPELNYTGDNPASCTPIP